MTIIATRTSGGQTYRTFQGQDALPLSPSYAWHVRDTRTGHDVTVVAHSREEAVRLGRYHLSPAGERAFRRHLEGAAPKPDQLLPITGSEAFNRLPSRLREV